MTLLKLRQLLRWTPPMRRYLADPGAKQREPLSVDQVMGAAMVFPKAVIDKLEGFDDRYWIWFEEVDLCQRVKKLDLDVVYFPDSQIVHHGNSSFGQVYSVHKHRWFMQSLRRYTKTYWSRRNANLLIPFMVVSFFLTFVQTLFKRK
jgi:GT2 family glycosyltransferase